MALILFAASLGALCVPGILLSRALGQCDDRAEMLTEGAILGLALAVILAFYVAYWKLSWFWALWFVVAITAVIAGRKPGLAKKQVAGLLPGLLLLVAITRFAPTLVQPIPPGWDPSFHLILVKKLLLLDHTFEDWLPFADVRLNYPLGSHLLVAVMSRLTHVAPERTFQFLIPAFGVLTTAQVYFLARRALDHDEVALYAAAAYGFWAYLGSIGYYAWGGLPNQLGMLLLLAALTAFVQAEWSSFTVLSTAILIAASVLVHHHVMLVAGGVIAIAVVWRIHSRMEIRRTVLAIALAILLASPQLLRMASRVSSIGTTDVLRFSEPHTSGILLVDVGIVLVVFATVGLVVLTRARPKKAGLLLAVTAALVVAYLVCGPAYRAYSLRRFGQEFSALTPSRFLTDAAYFLSIYAGYAFFKVTSSLKLQRARAVALALLLGLTNIPQWTGLYRSQYEEGRWLVYRWIEQNTESQAIVAVTDPWASYATWRRTPSPPLPVSEPRATPPAVAGTTPVYEVVAPLGKASTGKMVWQDSSGWSVVRIQP